MYLINNIKLNEELVKSKLKQQTMYVAQIISVDTVNNKANILPVLMDGDIYGNMLPHPIIASVPIMSMKTKIFNIQIPYSVGDLVYVGCSKYSVDMQLESGAVSVPNTRFGARPFTMSNSVILGGLMSEVEPKLDATMPTNLILQNRINGAKIEIMPTGVINIQNGTSVISMDATGKVTMTSPSVSITSTGNIDLSATAGITMTSPNVTLDKAGNMMVGVDVKTKAGISLATHTHGNGNDGSPTTSPIPV